MIFRKKSKIEKVSDAMMTALDFLGTSPPNLRRRQTSRLSRVGRQGIGVLAVAAPIAWRNRDKIKAAIQEVQNRLETTKKILSESPEGSEREGQEEKQRESQ